LNTIDLTANLPAQIKGSTPFETIRHVDSYGREYWSARELMPLLGYSRWENFTEALDQARAVVAAEQGERSAQDQLRDSTKITKNARGHNRHVPDVHLSRHAAYLTTMRGDSRKPEIAAALTYFAVRAREAELHDLAADEIGRTALARAREMIDYKTFRDMMSSNAPDYQPSSKLAGLVFGAIQNKLYRHITGYDASGLRGTRELETWPGRQDGAPAPSERAACRNVAKNYMSAVELAKLNRMVGRLCLAAEGIAEDGRHLSLLQWEELVADELALNSRWSISAA
jgi:hypothetical protein